jgi:hypothetical protein
MKAIIFAGMMSLQDAFFDTAAWFSGVACRHGP